MPTRRFAETTPDLFSVTPAKAPRPAASHGNPKPDKLASQSRHLLPKDLAGALKHLDDAELHALCLRRSRPRPSVAVGYDRAKGKSHKRVRLRTARR